MNQIERRLHRLEANSPWGGKAELEAAGVVFMRVPEGGESDPSVVAARLRFETPNQCFCVTSSPAAASLPLWTPVPIDRVPTELLDASIAAILAKASAWAETYQPTGEPSEIDNRILQLPTPDDTQEFCMRLGSGTTLAKLAPSNALAISPEILFAASFFGSSARWA